MSEQKPYFELTGRMIAHPKKLRGHKFRKLRRMYRRGQMRALPYGIRSIRITNWIPE